MVLGVVMLGSAGCINASGGTSNAQKLKRYQYSKPLMGTHFELIFYAPNDITSTQAAAAAFSRIAKLNSICSDYDKNSELMRFCKTAGQGKLIQLSPDLYRVLVFGQKLAQRSGGKFDMSIGHMKRAWARSRRIHQLPSAKRMAQIKKVTGYQHLVLKSQNGKKWGMLKTSGVRLDLGGIAKGYAADQAIKVLKNRGITRALVNAGGDITVSQAPPGKQGWHIAILGLNGKSKDHKVWLVNASVATSGDKFQFVQIGGVRYSHLLDPVSGLGLNGRRSVSVVAKNGMAADALATAVSVMGAKLGQAMINQHYPDAEIYVLNKVGHGQKIKAYYSSGWPGIFQTKKDIFKTR